MFKDHPAKTAKIEIFCYLLQFLSLKICSLLSLHAQFQNKKTIFFTTDTDGTDRHGTAVCESALIRTPKDITLNFRHSSSRLHVSLHISARCNTRFTTPWPAGRRIENLSRNTISSCAGREATSSIQRCGTLWHSPSPCR